MIAYTFVFDMPKHSYTRPSVDQRIKDLKEVNLAVSDMADLVDKICRSYGVSRGKRLLMDARLKSIQSMMLGNELEKKKLSDYDLSRLINVIQNMSKDGKPYLLLMLADDNSGVIDPINGTKYEYT